MARWAFDNPVVTKEFRSRMRGSRAYWVLFSYLLLLSLAMFLKYVSWWSERAGGVEYGGAAAGFTVGREFFQILFYMQAILIAVITPALTAGAISIEREQRTFELLRSTTLPARAIVLGKLASSVSFVVLLLTSSLPLVSLCFLLGGVSPGEVFFAYFLLVCDACLFGALGLAWSAYAANTATATALSYGSLFLYFVATLPFAAPILFGNGSPPSFGLSAVNPLGAVAGAVTPERYYGWTGPAWVPALLINGTLGLLVTLACINRLDDFPSRRAGMLRLVTLLLGGLILFLANGMVFGYAARYLSMTAVIMLLTGIGLGLLLVFVPTLVSGDLADWTPRRSALATVFMAWTPRRIFKNATVPSGLPLALLLTALTIGLWFAALRLGRSGFATPAVALALWHAGAVAAAVVVGMAGLGFLLSVVVGNRWLSLTVLYLVVLLAMAVPFFTYAALPYDASQQAARSAGVNTLYLCPFLGLYEISAALDPRASLFRDLPALRGLAGAGVLPMWLVSLVLYLTVAGLSYVLAFAVLRRRAAGVRRARSTEPALKTA